MDIDKKMKILIVDDMQPVRQALANILRVYGFSNIAYASNGQLALDALRGKKPELILLDWNMPKMTGIEFLRELRVMDGYEDVPVVMVTAENNAERVREAIKEGVSGYLIKPFSPNDIKERLSAVLGVELEEESAKKTPDLYIPS